MFTPQFFDILVIIVAIVGLVLAALRIASDFRQGPRFAASDVPDMTMTAPDLPAKSSQNVPPIQESKP